LGRNQRIEGAWVWTNGGGPLRAGPLSLYPFSGFWQLVDANVYATARLLERPDSDPFAVTRDWVRDTYDSDPVLNEAITELLLESHSIVEQGLYIRPFAEKQVLAFGLEPPPMMWIFKWDIVDGSSSALSAIYLLSSSDKEFAAAVGEGDVATDRVSRWRQRLATLQDHVRTENRKDFEMLLESLGYQADLFETLSLYRRAFLNFYRWLDRGEEHAYTLWKQAYEQFEQRRSRHESTYAGNLDFPAYSFFAAEAGLLHARRTLAIAWASRIALILGIAAVLGGTPALHPHWPDSPWRHALNGLYCGLFTPWRSPEPAMKKDAALRLLVLVLGTSLLTQALFTSLASPSFLVGIFGMTIALALGMKFALNGPAFDFFGKVVQSEQQERMGRDAFAALALAPLFALALHFLAVLSIRGPLYFWYEFWTRAGFRSGFTVLYVFLFLWLLFAITACGARAAHAAGKRAPLVHGLAATGAGMGAALACLGMLLGFPGLENALTTVNDEMAVLPMGLSRILGIATHLNIPLSLPSRLVGVGVILVVPAAIFRIWARYRKEAKG
ncbi:MAG: hypothetical protein HGB17_05405, partial [Syntrophobacteraceae bacterium]|nr:hypothetical protein [Syntrophobacteraceae bacterium]